MWLHDMMPAHWFLTSSALKSFHQGREVLWEPFGQLCQTLRCKPCQNFCIFLLPCWHSVSTTHPPTRLQCHLVAPPWLTLNPWSEFFSPEPNTSHQSSSLRDIISVTSLNNFNSINIQIYCTTRKSPLEEEKIEITFTTTNFAPFLSGLFLWITPGDGLRPTTTSGDFLS